MGIRIPGNSPEKKEDDGPERERRQDSIVDGNAEAAVYPIHGAGSAGQHGRAAPWEGAGLEIRATIRALGGSVVHLGMGASGALRVPRHATAVPAPCCTSSGLITRQAC